MGKKTIEENTITEGIIWKQLLIFFFPIMLGTLIQQLYTTVDTIIVGRFVGKAALASVGGPAAVYQRLLLHFLMDWQMERQLSLRSITERKTKEDCIQDFILHIYFPLWLAS